MPSVVSVRRISGAGSGQERPGSVSAVPSTGQGQSADEVAENAARIVAAYDEAGDSLFT